MLKQALTQAPALWLPDPKNVPTLCPQKKKKKGIALEVLTQTLGILTQKLSPSL